MEEKFRKAMVANASMDNEKSQLMFQVSFVTIYCIHFFELRLGHWEVLQFLEIVTQCKMNNRKNMQICF